MSNKRFLAVLLALALMVTLVACTGGSKSSEASTPDSTSDTSPVADPSTDPSKDAATTDDDLYIAVISKGFQHQFWQVVKAGADAAAADLGVTISFDGPASESDIQDQVNMLKAELSKDPDAIALAALSTESVMDDLNDAKNRGIPVVGFDSGVPDAPEGSIYATASTDNKAAAAIAGEKLLEHPKFKAALETATSAAPIIVGVISQDATSESVISRTVGFIDKVVELLGEDQTSVRGHEKYTRENAEAKVILQVVVPATTENSDLKAAAESILTTDNLVAVYGSNEAAAGGILAASNDGSEFAEGAKFGDIIAIGFDAGKTQRVAVENGWFYGSITQDPYQIGYKAVELAVKAVREGGAATNQIVDTGAKWYNKDNINDADITDLVYE